MTTPFMQNYARFVIKICHQRGAHAIGGMAAQIPIKSDSEENVKALNAVKEVSKNRKNFLMCFSILRIKLEKLLKVMMELGSLIQVLSV